MNNILRTTTNIRGNSDDIQCGHWLGQIKLDDDYYDE